MENYTSEILRFMYIKHSLDLNKYLNQVSLADLDKYSAFVLFLGDTPGHVKYFKHITV